MYKEKEIEEMARDCGKLCDNYGSVKCANQDCKDCVRAIDVAQTLYGKGYRNFGVAYPTIDDETINDTADLNTSLKVVGDRLGELIEKIDEVRKETAKEIYERVDKWIDEMVPHTKEWTILFCLLSWIKMKYDLEVDDNGGTKG